MYGIFIGLGITAISILSIEDILQRPDLNGNYQYSVNSIKEYIKLPFNPEKRDIAWPVFQEIPLKDKAKLLSMNWLFMASSGFLIENFLFK